MTWTLVAQVIVLSAFLAGLVALCGGTLHGSVLDNRREDARKRKENGL